MIRVKIKDSMIDVSAEYNIQQYAVALPIRVINFDRINHIKYTFQ